MDGKKKYGKMDSPANSNLKALSNALQKRKSSAAQKRREAGNFYKTETAAKLRGEMGYNPSGTQGAKDTEAKYMRK
jgi:hypothetical protein